MNKTKYITLIGLFLAIGLILPYISGHAIGIPGTVLLPMYLPIIVAGFILGPSAGYFLGMIVPTLSHILFNMPPIFILPVMIVDLSLYGLMVGILSNKLKLNIYISLILSLIISKLGYATVLYICLNILHIELFTKTTSALTTIIVGLPGIIIQIIIIPPLIKILRKLINE